MFVKPASGKKSLEAKAAARSRLTRCSVAGTPGRSTLQNLAATLWCGRFAFPVCLFLPALMWSGDAKCREVNLGSPSCLRSSRLPHLPLLPQSQPPRFADAKKYTWLKGEEESRILSSLPPPPRVIILKKGTRMYVAKTRTAFCTTFLNVQSTHIHK